MRGVLCCAVFVILVPVVISDSSNKTEGNQSGPPVDNSKFLEGLKKKDKLEGRNFQVGGGFPGQYPPFAIPQSPQVFPENCGIYADTPNVLDLLNPPIDIPYCFRIPCSVSDPSLETQRYACHSQPGCYFDVELYNYRRSHGYNILPGVPVCQRVIRNKKFAQAANAAVAKVGKKWNGLFTNCFLQQNPHILESSCCDGLQSFIFFGARLKQSGWTGVTENECKMLDGCYHQNKCYYPPSYSHIQIRSGKDAYRNNIPSGRDLYGLEKCLDFNPSGTPESILNDYHSCLQAGCVVDPEYDSQKLQGYLCSIVKSDRVPYNIKVAFWRNVQSGNIRADNWEEYLSQLQSSGCQSPAYFHRQRFGGLFGGAPTANRSASNLYLPGCTSFYNLPVSSENSVSNPNNNFLHLLTQSLGAGSSNGHNSNPSGPYLNPNLYRNPIRPRCPYVLPYVPGLPQLKGRLTDCCKRNYCYIPRHKMGTQSSGVAAYFSSYGSWSNCSETCGGGTRQRSRTCIKFHGKGECSGESDQTETCNVHACPKWEPWGTWGPCNAKCGGGRQERSRQCLPSGAQCVGSGVETKSCKEHPCPTYSSWSAWNKCSVSVGQGSQTRNRYCDNPGKYGCKAHELPLKETKVCTIYCQPTALSNGPCIRSRHYPYQCYSQTRFQCPCGHCRDFKLVKYEPCTCSRGH